ncbi:hypothetical protein ONE63_011611 [Megalurothrips usitatus]|uniref:MULE transposase domain-containing protein n=1 Tax=Megalurothrips usitatus TaxID=439358 RepID=A0AAV7X1E6_9NEOP|nr:hypothetical protein ONE63_011611 [Megalurothrips usitatus]
MSRVLVETGLRKKTNYFHCPDGYSYHFNRFMRGGRVSLRCIYYNTSKRCMARASCDREGSSFRPGVEHRHRCFKSNYFVLARRFRTAVINECKCRESASLSLKSIYHRVRRRMNVPPEAAALWRFVTLRPSMQRARSSTLPPIPHTLSELATVLEDERYAFFTRTLDGTDSIFLGKFGQTRVRSRVLIFISRRLMDYMSRTKDVMSDGTFSSVPAALDCAQVWTILALRRHHTLPLVRVLMQSKLEACYSVALSALKAAVPAFKPRTVMCDFEPAQHNAWESTYPDIKVSGCLFHSSKAIAGHAKSIGLAVPIRDNEEVDSLVRSMCALALLPSKKLVKGIEALADRCLAQGHWWLLKPMFEYIRDTWCIPSRRKMFSVYKCPHRTSNACESCNSTLRSAVRQKHPNVWSFLFALLDLEDIVYLDICTLNAGLNPSRKRKASALANDDVIAGLTEDLEEGHVTIDEFLRRASRRIQNVYDQIMNL